MGQPYIRGSFRFAVPEHRKPAPLWWYRSWLSMITGEMLQLFVFKSYASNKK